MLLLREERVSALRAEANSVHLPNIEEWADERGLAISAANLSSLYSPLNLHNLTPMLKSLWTIPHCHRKDSLYTGRDLRSSIQIQCPRQIFSHPGLTPYQHPQGHYWYQQGSAKGNYMSLIRSLFMYAAPIWFTNISPSHIQKLQTIQNSALRIVTRRVKKTSIDHLHNESKKLPVQDHLSLISYQYLFRVLQPNNPSHSVDTSPSCSRNK